MCVHLCIFCHRSDRNADGILIQWLICHDSRQNGCSSSSSRFSQVGHYWCESYPPPPNTHTVDTHTILPNRISNNTDSVNFYPRQAVCLCIVTGGAKHTPGLFPYSVGVRHQNIFIIKMLTICGLCSTRIYSRFKSPHSPGEQNKECY